MKDSFAIDYGPIDFPHYMGVQVYMLPHVKGEQYPEGFGVWGDFIDTMTHMVPHTGLPMYITIHQSLVKAGGHQRKPGPHVDGYWVPGIEGDIIHSGGFGGPGQPHHPDEAIIIASNVLGTKYWDGQWDGERKLHGDCSHIDLSGMEEKIASPGRIWAGHTDQFIHESIESERAELRTFVRVNAPGWVPSRDGQ